MEKINISVFIDRENKTESLKLAGNSTVFDMLEALKINPITVIISRNNELILEDEHLNNNDKLKILSVISGG